MNKMVLKVLVLRQKILLRRLIVVRTEERGYIRIRGEVCRNSTDSIRLNHYVRVNEEEDSPSRVFSRRVTACGLPRLLLHLKKRDTFSSRYIGAIVCRGIVNNDHFVR